LALVACWALLCLSYSASNAEVISVPIGTTGLNVTLQTGPNAQALQNLYNNPSATSVGQQLEDDGNVHVPLQFSYPYWGKNFTESWMHSNGVVSFQNPNVTGSFCCSGVNLSNNTSPMYNYAVFPLWTDLFTRYNSSAYYLGDTSSMTYGWYGTTEFSNPDAKSTFEVKIDKSGGLDMKWGGALITRQFSTIGFTGDLSKGEYFQAHHGSNLNIDTPTQMSISGTGVDPCVSNPLYSTSCAGYKEAYLQQQCNLDQLFSASCPGYGIAYAKTLILGSTISNASGAASITSSRLSNANQEMTVGNGATPLQGPMVGVGGPPGGPNDSPMPGAPMPGAPMPGGGPGPAGGGPGPAGGGPGPAGGGPGPEGAKPGISTSQALAMISSNAAKESNLAMAVSNAAISQAAAAGDRATQDAQKIATTSSVQSIEAMQTTTSLNTTVAAVVPGSTSVVQIGGFKLPGAISISSVSSFNAEIASQLPMAASTSSSQTFNNEKIIQLTAEAQTTGTGLRLPTIIQAEIELPKAQEELKTGGISTLLTSSSTKLDQFSNNDSKTDNIKKNVQDNSLAGGVSLSAIATSPIGYNTYFTTLPDASFYAPKEIYKNQKVIDNQRVLRQLSSRSDKLHEEMINGQFR